MQALSPISTLHSIDATQYQGDALSLEVLIHSHLHSMDTKQYRIYNVVINCRPNRTVIYRYTAKSVRLASTKLDELNTALAHGQFLDGVCVCVETACIDASR